MTGAKSRFGLDRQGMHHLGAEHWNRTAPELYEHAVRRGEGELALGGSFSANTGAFTGRTPRDKYIVDEPGTKDTVWWGKINQPVPPSASPACTSACSPICRAASSSFRTSMPAPTRNTGCRCAS